MFWKLRKVDAKAETEPWLRDDDLSERVIPLLRHYTVFNVAQIDGLPPEMAEPEPSVPTWPSDEMAERVVSDSGADIRHGGSVAFYRRRPHDYIQIPEPKAFDDMGAYYATAFHELVHWTGDETYALEELVAEFGSAFLCRTFQVDGSLRHPEYLGHWLGILRGGLRGLLLMVPEGRARQKPGV